MNSKEIEYGEIKGILTTFANFNNKRGYSYKFDFIREKKDFPLKNLIELYCSKEEANYNLFEVNDWKTKLAECLEDFLFQYFTDKHSFNCLYDSENIFSFSNSKAKKQYISVLIDKIEKFSIPIKVWWVNFDCFINGIWQGFIFESIDFNYFILLEIRINMDEILHVKSN